MVVTIFSRSRLGYDGGFYSSYGLTVIGRWAKQVVLLVPEL